MSYRFNRGYRYRLTNPPQALLKARMDNIAIVPASMLPLTKMVKEKVNTLPGRSTVNRGHEHHRSIRRCSAREGRPRCFGGAQRGGGT
jgi:hypothetical protein